MLSVSVVAWMWIGGRAVVWTSVPKGWLRETAWLVGVGDGVRSASLHGVVAMVEEGVGSVGYAALAR